MSRVQSYLALKLLYITLTSVVNILTLVFFAVLGLITLNDDMFKLNN